MVKILTVLSLDTYICGSLRRVEGEVCAIALDYTQYNFLLKGTDNLGTRQEVCLDGMDEVKQSNGCIFTVNLLVNVTQSWA